MEPNASRPVESPLSQHLRELASRRGAWLVLARNAVPVVGVCFLGWSGALAVSNYWFDGLVALAAIIAALVPRALRETRSRRDGPFKTWLRGILTWLVLVGVLGLPYWLVLIPLHDFLLSPGLLRHIAHTPQLLLTFGMIATLHARRAFTAGYDAMPEAELKQRVRWDAYLLILRAVAMFLMASPGFAIVLVPAMALVLSYFEIWPERVLGATFGEASKLHEYDPHEAKPKRRRLP